MRNENSEHIKIEILARSKLNSIESTISKAIEEAGNSKEENVFLNVEGNRY